MRSIRTLLLLMCLTVTVTAFAESINENQARAIAAEFMAGKAMPSTNLITAYKAPRLSQTTDQASYYVFNSAVKGQGYVIVAGDDRAPAVLGYSDRGCFDISDVPEALQELLEVYTEQIEALSDGAQPETLRSSGAAIRPLVTANWSQNNPFNIKLPYVSTGKHAVVGCVATALAQVMHYWQWPSRPTQTIPAYTSSTLSIYMPALSPVDFNWSAMQDNYETTDTTSVGALAAATLSLYCAQSVEMNFKTSSSGATTVRIPMAISSYFGYKPSAHSLSRGNYSSQQWADLLYAELAAGRPVIYAGAKGDSGHAFVCDGYDGTGMFHINWGWNGKSNGYFLLSVLNPDLQGTGSASGAYGYICRQAAIVGIEPGTDGVDEFAVTAANVTLDDMTTTRSGSNYDFYAVVSGRYYNYTANVIALYFGWGLYQGDTMVDRLYYSYYSSLNPGSYLHTDSRSLGFGKGLTSGTYRIVPIYSEYGTENWRPCIGSDLNYIEVTINGNNCTIKGHGTAAEHNYTINNITFEGSMHHGRPVDIFMNMTNNGESMNELLHMFVNGEFKASGYVCLEQGETGDVMFRFLPETAGTYTLTFSWNEDGSNPIASRTLNITQMPAANLSATIEVLNVTSTSPRIITSRQFAIKATVTNNGSTTYDEDISARLCKHTTGNSGAAVEVQTQHLTLAPGASTTLDFALDNVTNGWQYFVYVSCYSEGSMVNVKGTSSYTIVFPEEPEYTLGDVNEDGVIDIDDITAIIHYVLTGDGEGMNVLAADYDQSGNVDIDDITAVIDRVLHGPSTD